MADISFNSQSNSETAQRVIQNYINGEWLPSSGTETVDIINPATGEQIGLCPLGTAGDVDTAVAAAKQAFVSWRQTPVIDRVQPLFRLKTLFEDAAEDLARQVTIEHGKTLVEARGSVRRGIQMIETACGMPSLLMGDIQEDIAAGIDSQSINRPMGVFACIAPFNFPAMVPMWFWPFAVACGNTYVLKPSERVPLTQLMMFDLLKDAGFPDGVVNMVHGAHDVVNAICTHPDIQGVSFVGSTPVARHVYETGCAAGKRVQALGGAKNFMLVLPDAVMDKAAATATESIIGCAGERCLAGSVIVNIGAGTLDKIQPLVIREAESIRVGNGLADDVDMGPVISAEAKARITGLIERALEDGAELLVDGRVGVEDSPGYFLKPTVLGKIRPDMEIAQVEVFGPVILLAETDTFDDAIEWINNSPFANTATLFTTSGAAARQFSHEAAPTMLGINIGVPAPMAFFSFGGAKDSFFGDIRAHGSASVDFFTNSCVTIQRWTKDSSIW